MQTYPGSTGVLDAESDAAVKTLGRGIHPFHGGLMEQRRDDERPADDDSPIGGDETTEDQLEADNPVEEETLETLDPDNPPA